ncbi:MAG: SRPBCC family protein [Alphaproteobacteria bacterium]|nr:SRPBCC family protein [Alphaproteobacteria bacterium]
MLKKILGALAVALALFSVMAAMQPDAFKVTRSTDVDAATAEVFVQVNNLSAWKAWSPWAKLDPDAQMSFEGPKEGVGALMRWSGNMEVGEGSMAITESVPFERIAFKLDFTKPMKGESTASFTFVSIPETGGARVTWTMEGKNGFLAKAMGLIFNCEKMVGEQFEKGLANLKQVAEASKRTGTPAQ